MTNDPIIIGIDEAGRGALAGPVYAGCVFIPKGFDTSVLADSKALTPEKRELARKKIIKSCIYGIGCATHNEIDRMNILKATFLAMRRAFENFLKTADNANLPISAANIIVDGNLLPDFLEKYDSESLFSQNNARKWSASALIKADACIHSVMAASILAKTERDRIMVLASRKWSEYGYEKHKGYGTKNHLEAIKKYGPSPISRKTFKIH